MGFKDLVRFNEAMLAKQVWKLQTEQTSLLYKVYNTKYFPTSWVFEAKSKKGSFTWQSILKARHVIEKAMLWRVGDGSKIRVFHDNWIPECFPTKAPHTQDIEDDLNVCSLIDQTTNEWNEQMIDQKIAPFMAHRIKAIPLCRTAQGDYLVCPRTRDDSYSVKMGFQLLGEVENTGVASGSNSTNLKNFWKGVWSLQILNKMKHFCWRACTKSFPTLANLYQWKVVDLPLWKSK